MGYAGALGMAQQDVSLEAQLHWHCTANCFPPVPTDMIPVFVEAIEMAREGKYEIQISLQDVATIDGKDDAEAGIIIDAFHLEAWLEPCSL